ncbi:FLZ-type domain-containing protein [Caenorhabditis elegans]|uniref:FLZ-type domain-containing protein n=1 Tax=Caenorhabditis elegans TaxID=6239 RepID=Q9XWX1_CAEEL|nr:FLZ-type domain-containing protein [Caenorhabditis elegans]CAA21516.1 FLZ-type domain-containing protein [Caenorhabditis elegans]|eukprot:NP_507790.1 Uncharacterized protein CELE_Y43F8B.9 [Caenorhabditis elegans]
MAPPAQPPPVAVKNTKEAWTKFMKKKAEQAVYPSKESSTLQPKYLFDASTLVLPMCFECRRASRHLEMAINLCSICRANFEAQIASRFFRHDVLLVKRKLEANQDTTNLKE